MADDFDEMREKLKERGRISLEEETAALGMKPFFDLDDVICLLSCVNLSFSFDHAVRLRKSLNRMVANRLKAK